MQTFVSVLELISVLVSVLVNREVNVSVSVKEYITVSCIYGLCVYGVGVTEAVCLSTQGTAPCGLRGCKNRPTPFPARMS